jgi:hypothetical protein
VIELADGDQGRDSDPRNLRRNVPAGHGSSYKAVMEESGGIETHRFENTSVHVLECQEHFERPVFRALRKPPSELFGSTEEGPSRYPGSIGP